MAICNLSSVLSRSLEAGNLASKIDRSAVVADCLVGRRNVARPLSSGSVVMDRLVCDSRLLEVPRKLPGDLARLLTEEFFEGCANILVQVGPLGFVEFVVESTSETDVEEPVERQPVGVDALQSFDGH